MLCFLEFMFFLPYQCLYSDQLLGRCDLYMTAAGTQCQYVPLLEILEHFHVTSTTCKHHLQQQFKVINIDIETYHSPID